jgi:hypothetical protein
MKEKRGSGKSIEAEPPQVPSKPETDLPKEVSPAKVNQPKSKKTAASKAPVAKKSALRKKPVVKPTFEQIQLRAYFIAERRRSLGISGDETADWIQAERELLNELGDR